MIWVTDRTPVSREKLTKADETQHPNSQKKRHTCLTGGWCAPSFLGLCGPAVSCGVPEGSTRTMIAMVIPEKYPSYREGHPSYLKEIKISFFTQLIRQKSQVIFVTIFNINTQFDSDISFWQLKMKSVHSFTSIRCHEFN